MELDAIGPNQITVTLTAVEAHNLARIIRRARRSYAPFVDRYDSIGVLATLDEMADGFASAGAISASIMAHDAPVRAGRATMRLMPQASP
jgi:hypothetical protein